MFMHDCLNPVRIGRKFTLIELLVVVGIISTLASLVLPSLIRAKALSHKTLCQNNLKQLGVAEANYVLEYGYYFKGSSWWQKTSPINTYFGYDSFDDDDFYRWNAATVLNCPASPYSAPSTNFYCDYGANKDIHPTHGITRANKISSPSQKVMILDAKKQGSPSDGGYWPLMTGWEYRETNSNHVYIWTDRHLDRFNSVWGDGHVESRFMGDLEDVRDFRVN